MLLAKVQKVFFIQFNWRTRKLWTNLQSPPNEKAVYPVFGLAYAQGNAFKEEIAKKGQQFFPKSET